MNQSNELSKEVTIKQYSITFVILMILLVVTFVLAHIDLGPLNTATGMLIAAAKALLVVLYFMHIRYTEGLQRIAASVGLFWLTILILLALADYLSRSWILLPSLWPVS